MIHNENVLLWIVAMVVFGLFVVAVAIEIVRLVLFVTGSFHA